MSKKKINTPKKEKKAKAFSAFNSNEPMLFGKKNYYMMIVSIIVIIIGFVLMTGNEDVVDVKSMKLTVAPVVVMIGFIIGIFSVIMKNKEDEKENTDSSEQSAS
jgi:uncharacterized membrane protein